MNTANTRDRQTIMEAQEVLLDAAVRLESDCLPPEAAGVAQSIRRHVENVFQLQPPNNGWLNDFRWSWNIGWIGAHTVQYWRYAAQP